MEQTHFNILFRWFVGLGLDDRIWDATEFTKNSQRLLGSDIDVGFFESTNRASAIDDRATRYAGHEISRRRRKRVEEIFGWLKTIGLLRRVKYRRVVLVD